MGDARFHSYNSYMGQQKGGSAIWQGFDFHWKRAPHRLNHLESYLDRLSVDESRISGTSHSRFSVGRVPDSGRVRTFVTAMRSPEIHFVEGEVEALAEGMVGEPVEVDGPQVCVPLKDDVAHASVILRGFRLACTTSHVGVHPYGLGVSLNDINHRDNCLEFRPRFFVAADRSPDWFTRWKGLYAFKVTACFTVLTAPAGQMSTGGEKCTVIRHDSKSKGQGKVEHFGQSQTFNRAIVGIQGFRFTLNPWGRIAHNGRFVRRLQAYLHDLDYDTQTGRAECGTRLWFSNRGLITHGIDVEHRLWTNLIQYNDSTPTVESQVVEKAVKTGMGKGALASADFILANQKGIAEKKDDST
ncbi:MAG: hypothetical protein HN348_20600 [Proteobacteria bacterium]|nr:hypothetical protein [Pseudomonadota bacterium]